MGKKMKEISIFIISVLGIMIPLALYFIYKGWEVRELFYRNIYTGEINISLGTVIINTYSIIGGMVLLSLFFDKIIGFILNRKNLKTVRDILSKI